ncbi:uncharacterized protein LOC126884950 [Diabrotica virgifera virgifera]|uniref:Uncharacterized protein n=1 Tax=Diabrotica virgifera virgifera TaxID=50390 RepID=A0ABM5KAQ7_DIAVI|nr:uncharacterized protein LOC126884950 [Diabrotica virgifera virgifera]
MSTSRGRQMVTNARNDVIVHVLNNNIKDTIKCAIKTNNEEATVLENTDADELGPTLLSLEQEVAAANLLLLGESAVTNETFSTDINNVTDGLPKESDFEKVSNWLRNIDNERLDCDVILETVSNEISTNELSRDKTHLEELRNDVALNHQGILNEVMSSSSSVIADQIDESWLPENENKSDYSTSSEEGKQQEGEDLDCDAILETVSNEISTNELSRDKTHLEELRNDVALNHEGILNEVMSSSSSVIADQIDESWLPENENKSDYSTSSEEGKQQEGEEPVARADNDGNNENKKARKRIADINEWHDIKNKRLRQHGKKYIGWTRVGKTAKRGTPRNEKQMGPVCLSSVCKKSPVRQCQDLNEEDRKELFNNFWNNLTWDQKKIYIASLVCKKEKNRNTKKETEESRRKNTLTYTLKTLDGKILTVCKKLFLSTFALTEHYVFNCLTSETKHGMIAATEVNNERRREKRKIAEIQKETQCNKSSNSAKDVLRNFLDSLPKLPAHYCRKSTSKLYIEPIFGDNMSKVYQEYSRMCREQNKELKPVSRYTFDLMVKEKHISFHIPKKDRCDTCCSYETNNLDENVYKKHINNKEKARQEKENDKQAGHVKQCIVLTQDLQAVKVCPMLNASALYYKTKLCCHNFTIFNVNTHHVRCYWFTETEADLSANTFETCITDYLLDLCPVNIPIIIWSDGCTYQNRNATLSNALLSFSVENNVIIYQKYLERGHTQMEADSVHAQIEKTVKYKSIYLPSDYIRLTKESRKQTPYQTKEVTYDFIKIFSETLVYPSIRPGRKVNDPTVTDIKVIKYTPDGIIQVKLDYCGEFIDLPTRKPRSAKTNVSQLGQFKPLRNAPIKITNTKYNHLQQLKSVIPKDCHGFYDTLPHESKQKN